jgi:hypothetical protein
LCACDLGNRKLYFVPRKEADNREDWPGKEELIILPLPGLIFFYRIAL